MTPEQKTLVQATWTLVVPIAERAATLFYDRLFTLDPSLRRLFASDLSQQRRELVRVLATVVAALDRIETMVPALEDLGRRHVGYGVQSSHYETAGAALLWTLEQGLGEAWTIEVKEAWTAAYTLVAGTMMEAAANAAQAA